MSEWYLGGAEWDKCSPDDISYLYANPEVTEAFKLMDEELKND